MSTDNKNQVQSKVGKKSFFKSAMLPWMILFTLAIFASGYGVGVYLTTRSQNDVKQAASAMVRDVHVNVISDAVAPSK